MNMNKVLGRMIYNAIIDYGENYNITYRGKAKYVYHSDNNTDIYVVFQNGQHVEIPSVVDEVNYYLFDITIFQIVQYINLLLHTRSNIFCRLMGGVLYNISNRL